MRRTAFLALLLSLVVFAALLIPVAQAEIGSLQEPPYEPTSSYTYEPPIYETPFPTPSGSGGGPTDGRLNYAPDEYYTVYCALGFLEVWRGVPTSLLLDTVSISLMLSMSIGDTLFSAGGITIERNSEDTYTLYGSNGNLAPSPGAKGFSMTECISRNGGAPAEDTAESQPPPAQSPVEAFCSTEAGRQSQTCYSSTGAWCAATNYRSQECISYSLSRYLGYVLGQIFLCAAQGFVGGFGLVAAAGGLRWYARRK